MKNGYAAEKCSLCQSKIADEINATSDVRYWRCSECGLEKQTLSDLELGQQYLQAQNSNYEEDDLLFTKSVQEINALKAKARVKVVKKFLNSGKILEIGPGCGEFLVEASNQGFEVEAIETSKRFANFIRENLAVKTHEMPLEKFINQGPEYDAVYSSHVIEHVVDPVLYLATALKVVSPGGYFFVMTPNGACWEHALTRESWAMYTKAHLRIFTPDSLSLCMRKAGWEIESVRTLEFAEDWIKVLLSVFSGKRPKATTTPGKNIKRLPPWVAISIIRIAHLALAPLTFIQAKLNRGGDLFLIARKPLNSG